MADYDPDDEAADSDPSETLCCKFHIRIDSWLTESWETEQSPQHLDLQPPQKTQINTRNKKKN